METEEPRKQFNERTGRLEAWRIRKSEVENTIDPKTGLVREEILETRDCPLCGSPPELSRTLWVKEGLPYRMCSPCSMVYISPCLSEKYTKIYYECSASSAQWLDVLKAQEDLDRQKYREMLAGISSFHFRLAGGRPRLLDVGCSYGLFLEEASSLMFDFECVGLELATDAVRLAEERYGKRLAIHQMTLEDYLAKFPNEQGTFDIVTLWEVLEHVHDPHALLLQARSMLKSGGVIAVMVPNLMANTNRVLHEHSHAFGTNHLNYWSRDTLRQQLMKAGFSSEYRSWTIIGDLNTVWNYIHYEDPYEGGLVHPDFNKATRALLHDDYGYKLVMLARSFGQTGRDGVQVPV